MVILTLYRAKIRLVAITAIFGVILKLSQRHRALKQFCVITGFCNNNDIGTAVSLVLGFFCSFFCGGQTGGGRYPVTFLHVSYCSSGYPTWLPIMFSFL